MRPGGGRAKGHSFERWVAQRLRAIFPNARRGLQGRDGADAPDVDVPGWWIECKVGGPAKDPEKALAQAESDRLDAGDSRYAVAVCKRDRQEPMVYMRLSTLFVMSVTLYVPVINFHNAVVSMSFDDWMELLRTCEGDDDGKAR